MADTRNQRFTIRPFRAHTQMDNQQGQRIWNLLSNAITEIYSRNASDLSFEELYRNAYNLVLHRHGTLLYNGINAKISSQLDGMIERLQSSGTDNTDSSNAATGTTTVLLKEMADTWGEHRLCMIMIRDILMYMDRTYVTSQRKRPVYELGLHLFRVKVWEHENIQTKITNLLLNAISSERAGLLTEDISLLKENLSMLLELGQTDGSNIYERDFETVFLGTTQEFYRLESLDYLSKNTACDYVAKAEARLQEESHRAKRYLANTTEAPLLSIVEKELVERHAKTLVEMENSGFAALLKDETKIKEMTSMYDLFARVPSTVDYLRDALSERIKADGKKLVSDQERGVSDPTGFVRGVLDMRSRYTKVVEVAFRGEKRASKRLKESFEDFLNADARAAKCLGIYVDELLRGGLRGKNEKEVTAELAKVIIIFRYLSDKDVFEAFYKQHLAKRLLGVKSVSEEAERAMVSQLKAECGYQFTSKLEGMFNDMRISRDTRDSYKQHKLSLPPPDNSKNSSGSTVDIEVDVLTTGYWPSQNVPQCTLPLQVTEAIERFANFYLKKHTGRKLSWQTSTGSAEIRAIFGTNTTRRYDLCVSTYQMCILMLFNQHTTRTLGQIREATHIPDMELRRQLISLCTSRHRILRKGSRGKAIASDEDTFTFHREYTSKLKRVKIPLVSMKETVLDSNKGDGTNSNQDQSSLALRGDASSIPAPVEEDRRHLMEAAIVRIMKARKTLHHNVLIAETLRQLSTRFKPTPQFIKKRIESLIEREYLERSSEDRKTYVYVA